MAEMDETTMKALKKVVEQFYRDERKSYCVYQLDNQKCPVNHIYISLEFLRLWIEKVEGRPYAELGASFFST